MNDVIRNLNLNQCLFFDIETVRNPTIPPLDILRWQFRDRDTDKLATEQEAIEGFLRKGALFPEFGKIICISIGVFKNDTLFIKSYYGDDEAKIISEFVRVVSGDRKILIAFNGKGFDLPYLRKRAMICGVNYLTKIQGNDSGCKPWDLDGTVVDPIEHWKGSNYMNTSLELICYALDIPTPKGGIRGNEVSETYFAGGINTIVKYCEGDVIAVANVIRRWRDEPLINDDVKVLTEEIAEPKGLVERIRDEGLTPELYKELLVKQKTLGKEEKEKAIKIIEAALVLRSEKLTAKQIKELSK